jgi:hypothetical protein
MRPTIRGRRRPLFATGLSEPTGGATIRSHSLRSRRALAVAHNAPQPPAGGLYGANTGFPANSAGISTEGRVEGGWSIMITPWPIPADLAVRRRGEHPGLGSGNWTEEAYAPHTPPGEPVLAAAGRGARAGDAADVRSRRGDLKHVDVAAKARPPSAPRLCPAEKKEDNSNQL